MANHTSKTIGAAELATMQATFKAHGITMKIYKGLRGPALDAARELCLALFNVCTRLDDHGRRIQQLESVAKDAKANLQRMHDRQDGAPRAQRDISPRRPGGPTY